MDAPARQGIEIGRQNGHQGFAFAGFHLGDAALMQHNAADELHRIGPQTDDPVGSLPDGREGLRQQIIQSLAFFQPGPEFRGFALQLLFRHLLILGFQRQNGIHHGLDFLQFTLGTGSEQLCDQSHWSFSFHVPGKSGVL